MNFGAFTTTTTTTTTTTFAPNVTIFKRCLTMLRNVNKSE